jgi:23S rRNA (cytosine1962-C5)-methyltransferase
MVPLYELIAFGQGRKLERFGSIVVERPSVAAEGLKKAPPSLEHADLIFRDQWQALTSLGKSALREGWQIEFRSNGLPLIAELKPTAAGHLGIFPEHYSSFERLNKLHRSKREVEALRVLNLFAYTGIGSLQAALQGHHVTHVDASRPAVEWAKRNYQLTSAVNIDRSLAIRFMVDDARKFCLRELRRGNRYHIICLDPPTYGHGPKGDAWQLDRDLVDLMKSIVDLLDDDPIAVQLSGHSDRTSIDKIMDHEVFDELQGRFATCNSVEVSIKAMDGRSIDAGYCLQWT